MQIRVGSQERHVAPFVDKPNRYPMLYFVLLFETIFQARHDCLQSPLVAVKKRRALSFTCSAPHRVPAAHLWMPWVANLDSALATRLQNRTEVTNRRQSKE